MQQLKCSPDYVGVHESDLPFLSALKLFLSNLYQSKTKINFAFFIFLKAKLTNLQWLTCKTWITLKWLNSRFYVLLRHNKLKWRYCIYNGLGIRRITLLNKMCNYHTPVFHMTKPILLSNQSKQSCKK